MRAYRPSPLLLAGAAAVAGVAAGLRWGVAGAHAPLFFLALAVLSLPALRRRRTRWRGTLGTGCAATLLAGAALGSRSGAALRAGCEFDIRSGDRVEVLGWLRSAVPPAPRARRVTLVKAAALREGRRCRLGALVVYATVPATVAAGAPVRARGEWRRFGRPGAGGWPPQPGSRVLLGAELEPGRAEAPGAGASGWFGPGPAERLRAAAADRLARRLPPDVAPLALGLTVADRDGIPPRLARRFADAGLAHLLAISGLHVGILAAGIVWLAGLALSRGASWGVAASVCGAYVAALGAPPAALRAALLLTGVALARGRGSPIRGSDLLGLAALLALLRDPSTLLTPGFQLSFAGFAGLGVGAGSTLRLVRARRERAEERSASARAGGHHLGARLGRALVALGASAGAFAFTAPIAASHFGRAAPIAILSNFAGVPLLAVAIAALAGTLLLPAGAAELTGGAAAILLRLLERLVDLVAALPWGHGEAAAPGVVGWVALGLLLLALHRGLGGSRPARALLPLAAAAGVWLAGPSLPLLLPARATLVCSLDVGQGDAAAVRTRRGRWILLDAGPPVAGERSRGAARFLASKGARRVELLVLSHPHLDHMGGGEELFRRFDVRRVLDAGNPVPSPAYERFLAGVEEEGAAWLPARAGARMRVDEVSITVLAPGPLPAPARREAVDANEASVIVRLSVGRFAYLNSGDASAGQERELVEGWPRDSLRADLLKLGHHGSRTSTDPGWLRAVAPRVAVISAGRGNRYGHPHPSTLARLDSAGVPRVWRTDREGPLCVRVGRDGSWRPPP